jgi:hypothetical protein
VERTTLLGFAFIDLINDRVLAGKHGWSPRFFERLHSLPGFAVEAAYLTLLCSVPFEMHVPIPAPGDLGIRVSCGFRVVRLHELS